MGAREDTEEERVNWHWRNSMRPVRFFGADARLSIPWFIVLFHARLYTFALAILLTIVFIALERRGLTFDAAIRTFRKWLLGQRRPSWMWYYKKKMTDFG